VDDISKNKCIIYVARDAFVLIAKERFPGTGEGFNNLSCRNQNMWFHYDKICVAYRVPLNVVMTFWLVVIHVEMELVCFIEGTNDPHRVHRRDPKLLRPFTLESHPEKNGAFHKAQKK